ncbi:MAG: creatininase family protein [Sedimentibacter sp.]|uniref:creatininase family protein n=1 Tax=Sedimentibacter sp. TaxID=1960295 RepID=UPI003158989E
MSSIIKEMSWMEFDERRKHTDTVIIPSGAIEVYGPQLPLGTDTIVAEEVSKMIAQKLDALIGPTVQVGESYSLGMFPGTLVIRPEHFKNYISDIFESLIKWGFTRFIFMNTHAGNTPIISQVIREYQDKFDLKCVEIDWWRFVQPNGLDIFENKGYMAHGHASECGTSVMMYLKPEMVRMDKLVNALPKKVGHYTEYTDFIKFRSFDTLTDIGSVGDSTAASVEKGEKIVNRCVDRIVEFVQNEL